MNKHQQGPLIYGRKKELHKLLSQYRELAAGPAGVKLLFVSGHSGIGKTALVQAFFEQIMAEGAFCYVGKYEQLNQNIPYSGLKKAFSAYIKHLLTQGDDAQLSYIREKLLEELGASSKLLVDYIPELEFIIGHAPFSSEWDPNRSKKRFFYLFQLFLDIVLEMHSPFVLFLDDLQWTDISSLNLLRYLLANPQKGQLLIVGCFRTNEVPSTHPLHSFFSSLDEGQISWDTLSLHKLEQQHIHEIIKERFPEVTERGPVVSVLQQYSQGNPLFIRSLFNHLLEGGWVHIENNRWVVDLEAISERYDNQTVTDLLQKQWVNMSEATYDLLHLAACVGNKFDLSLLKVAAGREEHTCTQLLTEVVQAGWLHQEGEEYEFSHDYIREALYENLKREKRKQLHYQIGNAMLSSMYQELSTTELQFTALQFNLAASILKQDTEKLTIAQLNLQAGNIARKNNAYELAIYYYRSGIDLLQSLKKEAPHAIWFALQLSKADSEYLNGNYEVAMFTLDELLPSVQNRLDKAQIYERKIMINTHLERMKEAVHILREGLLLFDLTLPMDGEQSRRQVMNLKQPLADFLMNHPVRDLLDHASGEEMDADTLAIQNLLYTAGIALHHTNEQQIIWQSLHIITTSLQREFTPFTAIGFVSYGRMLLANFENFDHGYEFGCLALQLIRKLEDNHLKCRVFGVFAFYVSLWKKHLQESLPILEEGIRAGIEHGDHIGANILHSHLLITRFVCGHPLQEFTGFETRVTRNNLEFSPYIVDYHKQLAIALSEEGQYFTLPPRENSPLGAKYTMHDQAFYWHHVMAKYYYLFESYTLAAKESEAAAGYSTLQKASPLYAENIFYWSLAMMAGFYNYCPDAQDRSLRLLQQHLNTMNIWQQHCPGNFGHKYLLMEAEYNRIHGHLSYAQQCYQQAIAEARRQGYVQNEALTHECYARFLMFQREVPELAGQHLIQAINCYGHWGATAKVKFLKQKYAYLLPEEEAFSQAPDFFAMDELLQHLGAEVDLEVIIEKALSLFMKVAAAERCVLILRKGEEYFVQGEARVKDNFCQALPPKPLQSYPEISQEAVNYVLRSREQLLVSQAVEDELLQKGAYVQEREIQSVVCMPLVLHNRLLGALYLENNFRAGHFQAQRVQWIGLMARQTVVSIENALNYQAAQSLNEELRERILERERLHQKLQDQKSAYLKAIVETQEQERKRIAEDLHDSLGSLLSTVKLQFTGLQEEVSNTKQSSYEKALHHLDLACGEVRRIAHNMLPGVLSKFGLATALQEYAEQVEESSSLRVKLEIFGLKKRLKEPIEINLFRICQELIQNALKHAEASELSLQFIEYPEMLNVVVEDDGSGFDTQKACSGMGLKNVASRVNYLKGTCEVESQTKQGTTVIINIPLKISMFE
ncbi:AAA family ATPase [Rapidithrix thailandica]|uniref:AAA family ATPase n=1 Tax=Rapidithrix thailandica TaxID=413964 RepID=A0AAW9S3N9_9BACT